MNGQTFSQNLRKEKATTTTTTTTANDGINSGHRKPYTDDSPKKSQIV